MVKNKWLNALIFVGIGVVIGLGIGMGAARRTVIQTVSTAAVAIPDLPEIEGIEEFEFEDGGNFYFYQSDGGQSGRIHRMPEMGENRGVIIERVDCAPQRGPSFMPRMMRRPFGFGFGRGVLAFGLIGLGIALFLIRGKNKPSASVTEEAPPPPSDEGK